MKVEHFIGDFRYLLSNENLQVGDEVFSLIGGRFVNGEMYFHGIHFPEGFDNPDIIERIEEEYIYTNHGYSHPPRYFKLIKIEHQVLKDAGRFKSWEWIEIPLNTLT
jgi:hypothetical protein